MALDSDPYLADYQVDGLPMLPPALAVEALAQAASVLAGKPTRSASRVRLESPVVVPAGGQAELRICALRDGPLISAVLRCADSSFTVDHARAEFNCADCDELPPALMTPDTAQAALKQLVGAQSGLVDGAELYGPISFQDGRFRRIALLPEVTSRSCRALARGSDDQPWFEPGSAFADSQFLLGSPGLADATLQVLQASMPHRRLRTAGCATVRFSGKAAEGAVEIRAMAVPDVTAVPALGPAPAAEADPAFAVATASAAAEIADVRPLAPRPRSRKARRGLRHQAQAARHAPAGQDQAGQDQAGQDQAESAQTQQGPEARGRQPATFPAQAVPVQGRSPVWEHVGPPPVTFRTPGDQIAGQRWDIEAVDATGHLLLVWRGVEVRDAGPMPRRSAWPPPLLAVYLERTARDSGLDVSLRVSVRSGHLEGVRPGLLAAPVAAAAPVVPGPRPHDAAETPAAEEVPPADTAQPWGEALADEALADEAPGRYSAADPYSVTGFGLSVSAAVPVACAWSVIDAGYRQAQPPAAIAAVYAQLRAQLDESPVLLAARLRVISACLADAGADEGRWISAAASEGWVVLHGGAISVACALTELSGVPGRVAVAIATNQVATPAPTAHQGQYLEAAAHSRRGI